MLLAPEPGPATLKTRPWGGHRLAALYDPDQEIERPIGESWEFSTLAGSESRADGQPLSAVLGRPLPFLAKLLDTANDLSIQVHPQDNPATGAPGKEEAWVVLDAELDARVLAGVREGATTAELTAAIERVRTDRGDGQPLVDLLQSVPVQRGTIVLVPAGTIHAIGGGVLVAEIQQPTDFTYRVFDYGSERDLHLDLALDAARIDALPTVHQPGDPAGFITGQHLKLEVLAPGRHERRAERDCLIVPFGSASRIDADERSEALTEGSLRLATEGTTFTLEVAPGGGAVLGAIE